MVDNRLSVHFGGDQTKSILFSSKYRSKSVGQIDISNKYVKIKQYSKVTYLGCALDECLTGIYGNAGNAYGIYGNAGLHKSFLNTKIFI